MTQVKTEDTPSVVGIMGTCQFCGSFQGTRRIGDSALCEDHYQRFALLLSAPDERMLTVLKEAQASCDTLRDWCVPEVPSKALLDIESGIEEILFLYSLLGAREVTEGNGCCHRED